MELIPTHDEVVELLREDRSAPKRAFRVSEWSAFEGVSSGCARDALLPARQSS